MGLMLIATLRGHLAGIAPLRVQGVTAYPQTAASARVRIASFAPFLADYGIDLRHRPMLSEQDYALLVHNSSVPRKAAVLARSAVRAARLDPADGLLLVHRLLLLTPLPGVDPPRRLDVFDFDDDLLVGQPADAHRGFQWIKQERRRALRCIDRARLVIAANASLAAGARRYSKNVEVVPSCVDPEIQPLRAHAEQETVTIGWIGSHTTAEYLTPVLPVLARLGERRAIRLVIVGGDRSVQANWIEHRPWTLQRQPADLASFDIGIMPLPDTQWTQGKSGYKLLQYFAAGVPAVASPIGVNAQIVNDGRGLLAGSAPEWEAALSYLIGDADARREMGAAGRAFVEREYSYQRWAPELAGLLRGLN
jgi:glycosyltransferase involved in cell wall biosynthesis